MFDLSTRNTLTDYLPGSVARHSGQVEGQEHLFSGAPTPSGVETPRPDFQDKRLPGIMHGYFGQVGNKTFSKSSTDYAPVTTPSADSESHQARRGSTGSLGSLVDVRRSYVADTPPASDDMNFGTEQRSTFTQPPTPISAEPLEVEADGKTAENGGPLGDGGLASITHALRNFVRPKSTFSSRACRHQSLPTSSISRNSVPAAHFSNPTSSPHSPQHTTPVTPPQSEAQSSVSAQELNRLTSDAASGSREKNTPPLTPRALSTNEKAQRSPRSNASASDDGAQSTSAAKPGDALPTVPPKGKLAVKIGQGRGLKPAVDPYCVCVFDWNEYISQGPKQDRMEMDVDSEQKKPSMAAIAVRRTDSDMGKPMAIPMRSRQSSTNGHAEKGMEKVTNPHWDHEAVL